MAFYPSNMPFDVKKSSLVAYYEIFNPVYITDIQTYNISSSISLSEYGKKVIQIVSTLNQPVKISLGVDTSNIYSCFDSGSGKFKPCSIVVPGTADPNVPTIAMITEKEWSILSQPMGEHCSIFAQCDTAPLYGYVQFKLNTFPII